MTPKPIPDRWLNYQPIGQKIPGTRFIAFKVPLRDQVTKAVQDDLRLSCDSLLKRIPNIGMIIDLTNTNRYYNPSFFIKRGIRYEKLMIPGHEVPPANSVQMFKRMVHDYLKENANNTTLIGVHCTHGVNRTGYLICNFMVSEMKIDPVEAINSFEVARGHLIERQNYRNDLIRCAQLNMISSSRDTHHINWRIRSSHQASDACIYPNQDSTNRYSWRRNDRSYSPHQSRGFSIHQNPEDDSNSYSQRSWRDPSPRRKGYQSFDSSFRPRENLKGNHRPRHRRQETNRVSNLS